MEVSQSVVITVRQPCQAHIVGGTMILPLFAMCGQVVAIRSGDNLICLSLSVCCLIVFDFNKKQMEDKGGGISGENTVVLIIIIVILGAAHYIQKWTGIPVLDWLDTLGDWFLSAIGWLLTKFLELIAYILQG